MQQFTPYFPGFDNQQQQSQNQQQQQQQQQPQNNQVQQQQQQPMSLNGANLAIYSPASMPPLSVLAASQLKADDPHQHDSDIGAHGKPKRKQVKNACVNCQKACKKCDVGRPCQRCIKYGLTETCINSVRKERKKGVKRGPYKKRNKNGGESVTSSGTSTPAINSNLYNPPPPLPQSNGASTPTVTSATTTPTTSNTMPLHYQPFQSTQAYDPYGYNSSNAMMPQAYMVPNGLSQMYPTNPPVLSYQAAMNIISPQQQQPSPVLNNNGYRQDQSSPDLNASNNAAAAAAATPAHSTVATACGSDSLVAKVEEDDDDEGSKLTILSQLCSSVLANNDGSKPDGVVDDVKSEEAHQNTPPPSRPHSREASHENNATSFTADSTHTYVNSHLSHVTNSTPSSAYGTPGSSPAGSPLQPQPQQQQQPQAQQQ